MNVIRVYDCALGAAREVEPIAVRGVWALHRAIAEGGGLFEDYVISHVPTGATLAMKLSMSAETGRRLLELLPIDWAKHAGFGPLGARAAANRSDRAAVLTALGAWLLETEGGRRKVVIDYG